MWPIHFKEETVSLCHSERSEESLSGERFFAALRMTILHQLRLTRKTSYLKCIGPCGYLPPAMICNYSGLLVACGDSLMLVVSVGCAAAGGTAHTHHQTPANCRSVPIYLVECRFIQHVTVAHRFIEWTPQVGGVSKRRDVSSYNHLSATRGYSIITAA